VPRSTRSTPSPPPVLARSDTFRHHSNKNAKQRPTSFSSPQRPVLDWSTSYQASASSRSVVSLTFNSYALFMHFSAGVTEESSDEGSTSSHETIHRRGRLRVAPNGNLNSPRTPSAVHARRSSVSKHNVDKLIDLSESPDPAADKSDVNGTRQTTFTAQRAASPTGLRYSHRPTTSSTSKHATMSLLPETTRISVKFPWVQSHVHVNVDYRTLGEDILLLGALIFAVWKVDELRTNNHTWLFTGE
jgi:hypothetical protein